MGLISRKLLTPRPQELGKIKIGGKGEEITSSKGVKFRPPVKFDHFVVTTRVRDKGENFVRDEVIHGHPEVGEAPTELAGMLMFPTPEENFHSEMCHYKGRTTKVSTCDGETLHHLLTDKRVACLKAAGKDCPCKPYARLHLQLWASPHTLGYHVFRTTSWESANNIQTALEEIFRTFGTCYHAPVKLVVYPSEDTHDGKVSTSHKVGLVLAMGMQDVAHQIAQARSYAQLAGGEVKQLSAGVLEDQAKADAEDERDIAEEFFPDVSDQEIHAAKVAAALEADDPEEDQTGAVDAPLIPQEAPESAREAETVAASVNGYTPPDALKRHHDKYLAGLDERQMGEADRVAFQQRLHKSGLTMSPTWETWSKTDYLSAIVELEEIPVAEEVAS